MNLSYVAVCQDFGLRRGRGLVREHNYFVFFIKGLSFRIVHIDPVVFSRVDVALKHVNVVLIRMVLLEKWSVDDEIVLVFFIEHELTPLAHQLVEKLFIWFGHVGVL